MLKIIMLSDNDFNTKLPKYFYEKKIYKRNSNPGIMDDIRFIFHDFQKQSNICYWMTEYFYEPAKRRIINPTNEIKK